LSNVTSKHCVVTVTELSLSQRPRYISVVSVVILIYLWLPACQSSWRLIVVSRVSAGIGSCCRNSARSHVVS